MNENLENDPTYAQGGSWIGMIKATTPCQKKKSRRREDVRISLQHLREAKYLQCCTQSTEGRQLHGELTLNEPKPCCKVVSVHPT